MKKFSLLALLATLVTIGSVYATWIYVTDMQIEEETASLSVSITESVSQTIAGTITIDNQMQLEIDNAGNYKAVLSKTGTITVSYVKDDTKDTSSMDKVDLVVTVTPTNLGEYASSSIFKSFEEFTISLDDVSTAVDITDKVSEVLLLNDIVLDTLAEYNTFKEALKSVEITITVAPAETV